MPPVFPFCIKRNGIASERFVQNNEEPGLARLRNKGALVAVFHTENGNIIYQQMRNELGGAGKSVNERVNICLRKSKTNF